MSLRPSYEVTFHFFADKSEGNKILDVLKRLVQRKRLNKIALESTLSGFQQYLALKLQVSRTQNMPKT